MFAKRAGGPIFHHAQSVKSTHGNGNKEVYGVTHTSLGVSRHLLECVAVQRLLLFITGRDIHASIYLSSCKITPLALRIENGYLHACPIVALASTLCQTSGKDPVGWSAY